MLVCYLDDSGKDPQNLCTTIAGYVGRDTSWEAFEGDVEPWFTEFGVSILHAKDLHNTDGDFRGWSVLRKQAFIARICQARNPHVMLGVSMAAEKQPYQDAKSQRGKARTASPYSFCFNVIVDWILRDIRTGGAAHAEGIAFVIEAGHENNPDAERAFHEVRESFDLQNILLSISFVPKDACRAIQLADLLAFYSRRSNERELKARRAGLQKATAEPIDHLLLEGAQHRGFIATGFGEEVGSRFLSGVDA